MIDKMPNVLVIRHMIDTAWSDDEYEQLKLMFSKLYRIIIHEWVGINGNDIRYAQLYIVAIRNSGE
jgi:hypothetical protein